MLRHWRKNTVTNREQNRLEVYCMDETTVLGEALQTGQDLRSST